MTRELEFHLLDVARMHRRANYNNVSDLVQVFTTLGSKIAHLAKCEEFRDIQKLAHKYPLNTSMRTLFEAENLEYMRKMDLVEAQFSSKELWLSKTIPMAWRVDNCEAIEYGTRIENKVLCNVLKEKFMRGNELVHDDGVSEVSSNHFVLLDNDPQTVLRPVLDSAVYAQLLPNKNQHRGHSSTCFGCWHYNLDAQMITKKKVSALVMRIKAFFTDSNNCKEDDLQKFNLLVKQMANHLEMFPNRYGFTQKIARHCKNGGKLRQIKVEHFDGYSLKIRTRQFLEAADVNQDNDNNCEFGCNDVHDNVSQEWFTCCNQKENEVCPLCSFAKEADYNEVADMKTCFMYLP